MILTLRTLPRSSGETSVVLTRTPSHPDDPEVVGVFVTSRAACHWIMDEVTRLVRKAGQRLVGSDNRYVLRADRPSSGVVRLELDLQPGEEIKVGPGGVTPSP